MKLGGNGWSFDALRGSKLFLIKTVQVGYQVRLYDLATNLLARAPLKDPRTSRRRSPACRSLACRSPDGRYLFTLYLGSGGGAMIHELDLAAGTARCIDLPGDGDFAAAMTWALVVDPDGRTLWAVSPGYGRVVAIDVAAHRIRDAYALPAGELGPERGCRGAWRRTASGSPSPMRSTSGSSSSPSARSSPGRSHVAIALGFSPDLSRLWVVGERSRVSSLPVR